MNRRGEDGFLKFRDAAHSGIQWWQMTTHSKATIISMAVVTTVVCSLLHEGLGHGVTAWLRGDIVTELTDNLMPHTAPAQELTVRRSPAWWPLRWEPPSCLPSPAASSSIAASEEAPATSRVR